MMDVICYLNPQVIRFQDVVYCAAWENILLKVRGLLVTKAT